MKKEKKKEGNCLLKKEDRKKGIPSRGEGQSWAKAENQSNALDEMTDGSLVVSQRAPR